MEPFSSVKPQLINTGLHEEIFCNCVGKCVCSYETIVCHMVTFYYECCVIICSDALCLQWKNFQDQLIMAMFSWNLSASSVQDFL